MGDYIQRLLNTRRTRPKLSHFLFRFPAASSPSPWYVFLLSSGSLFAKNADTKP